MSHFYQKKILSIKIKVSEENEASSVRCPYNGKSFPSIRFRFLLYFTFYLFFLFLSLTMSFLPFHLSIYPSLFPSYSSFLLSLLSFSILLFLRQSFNPTFIIYFIFLSSPFSNSFLLLSPSPVFPQDKIVCLRIERF